MKFTVLASAALVLAALVLAACSAPDSPISATTVGTVSTAPDEVDTPNSFPPSVMIPSAVPTDSGVIGVRHSPP